jgi:fucose 4-O-acetylase-like acetyltransferase
MIASREHYFDNLKFLLIALVVVGHIIEPIQQANHNLNIIYTYIYSFHMPLFVLVSGFFAKDLLNPDKRKKVIVNYLVPYIVFQTLYYLYYRYALDLPDVTFSLASPVYIMWYLPAVFFWAILTPYFIKLKHPVIISVVVGLVAGYELDISDYMALSRTLVFFPFFLIGYLIDKKRIERLFIRKYRIVACVSMFTIFVGVYYLQTHHPFNVVWFYGRYGYEHLGSFEWYAAVYRVITYFISTIMVVSFMAIVPNTRTFFSAWGERTLVVYLFHGFIARYFLVKTDLYRSINTPLEKIGLILLGLLIAILLSTRVFHILGSFIINPYRKSLKKHP